MCRNWILAIHLFEKKKIYLIALQSHFSFYLCNHLFISYISYHEKYYNFFSNFSEWIRMRRGGGMKKKKAKGLLVLLLFSKYYWGWHRSTGNVQVVVYIAPDLSRREYLDSEIYAVSGGLWQWRWYNLQSRHEWFDAPASNINELILVTKLI